MAVKVTWENNSTGHDGSRVFMSSAPGEPSLLAAEVGPEVQEAVISSPFEPEACFSIFAFSGDDIGPSAEVCADTVAGSDISSAEIGDEIEGGIYAGVITYQDGRSFHIISAVASGESDSTRWVGSSDATTVTEATDPDDGRSNTELVLLLGFSLNNSTAFGFTRDYNGGGFDDWYVPSKNELFLVYSNLASHPEFSANVADGKRTWSSTEATSSTANIVRFSHGLEATYSKSLWPHRTRPIRRVPV